MTFIFLSVMIVLTTTSLYFIGEPALGPGFELSDSIGPIYLEYNKDTTYREFLLKTKKNTVFWYLNNGWQLYASDAYCTSFIPPSITGWSFIKESCVDLYTGNYMYPLIKDQVLPLGKTFFGSFDLKDNTSVIINQSSYLKYLGEGTLDVFRFSANKEIWLRGDLINNLSRPFQEWYTSWSNTNRFELYRHFYFPLDRNYPSWVSIVQILKESYAHPSTLLSGENWEDTCVSSSFTTIDFVESVDRIMLYNVDYAIWGDLYSPEQAMFRYYETSTGLIGFWTPEDLILSHEVKRIAIMLEKKPEEILAILHGWITRRSGVLYFNYVNDESFDWINDPWHEIGYVC